MDGCETPLASGDAGRGELKGGERPSCEVQSGGWKFCWYFTHNQQSSWFFTIWVSGQRDVPRGGAQRHTILAFGAPEEGRMSWCVGRRISAQWDKENGGILLEATTVWRQRWDAPGRETEEGPSGR